MRNLLFATLLCFAFVTQAQTIFGKWENKDDKTGKVDSVIEVYKKGDKAYAKIVEITNPERRNILCELCKGANKNQPILGMDILSGLKKDDGQWSGGKILDPKNGKVYKCYIELSEKDKLKIRGYVGFSAFGRTAYWYRKK